MVLPLCVWRKPVHSLPENLARAFAACAIVPVLTIEDVSHAPLLARALAGAGLTCAEVTLRTAGALPALKAMKQAAPALLVGAGTVLSPHNVRAALEAGSDFLVTPAMAPGLLAALEGVPVPVFPGVSTPGEALHMLEQGFSHLKFFPAEASGGTAALRAMAAPLSAIRFMPTGGIHGGNVADYLGLPNVFAAGGSWMVDSAALAAGDEASLSLHMRQAVQPGQAV